MSLIPSDAHSLLLAAESLFSQGLAAGSDLLFDPSRRTYWVFLLATLLLTVAVLAHQQKSFPIRRWLSACFSKRYLLSKSSQEDVAYWLVNSVLRVFVLIPIVGGQLVFTLAVVRFLHGQFGTAPSVAGSIMANAWVMMTVFTLTFLVFEDLSRYGLHRLMHRVPWLWRFHRAHHSAEVLTPLTLYRVHPVEMTLYYLRSMLVFGFVSGVFIYLWGSSVKGWQILGVDAIGFLFNFAGANLRHSHVWLSFGWLERWLISPAQHQLHHSSNPKHYNCNYGSMLAVWDRWFGSWRGAGGREALTFGLKHSAPLVANVAEQPLVDEVAGKKLAQ